MKMLWFALKTYFVIYWSFTLQATVADEWVETINNVTISVQRKSGIYILIVKNCKF